LPPWFAVGFTVIAVRLLTGREKLHALARRVDVGEVIPAGEFLILTGIVLPLLPNEPVTTLTTITPRHAWLALVVVCSLSYASYLAQRYWAAAAVYGWRPWAGFIRRPRQRWYWRGKHVRTMPCAAVRKRASRSLPRSCICAYSRSWHSLT
jgi:hypothetical protein